MARIAASKLWVPQADPDERRSDELPSVTVDNASFFQRRGQDLGRVGHEPDRVVRRLRNEHDRPSGSITYADNEAVIGSESVLAGSEIARGVLDEEVDLYDEATRDYVDKASGRLLVEGQVVKSQLLGDYDAITANGVTHYLGELKTDVQLGAD